MTVLDNGTELVILAYLFLNLVAFVSFGYDKWMVKRRGWRTSEARLLINALYGPFGAYLGMKLFHHKTRKRKFLLVPLFMLLHAVMIWFFFYK